MSETNDTQQAAPPREPQWNDAQNAVTDEAREEWAAKLHADAQRFLFLDLHGVKIDMASLSELGCVEVRTHRGGWFGDSLATATDNAMTDYPKDASLPTADQQTPLRDEPSRRCTVCGKLADGMCAVMADGKHRLRDEASAPTTKATHATVGWANDAHYLQRKIESLRHHVRALQMLIKGQHSPLDFNAFAAEVDAIDRALEAPLRESPAPQSTVAPSGRDNVSPDGRVAERTNAPVYGKPEGPETRGFDGSNPSPAATQQTPLPAERPTPPLCAANERLSCSTPNYCRSAQRCTALDASQAGEREPSGDSSGG